MVIQVSATLNTGNAPTEMKSVTRCGVAARRSTTFATPPPTRRPKPHVAAPRRARSATTSNAMATNTVPRLVSSGRPRFSEKEMPSLYCSRNHNGPTTCRWCAARSRRARYLLAASATVTASAIKRTLLLPRFRRWRGTSCTRRLVAGTGVGPSESCRSTRHNDHNCHPPHEPTRRPVLQLSAGTWLLTP